MSIGVHQVLAGAAPRDAITNHALAAQQVIRDLGFTSEIYCDPQHLSASLAGSIHGADAWERTTDARDLAVLHYSIDSPAFGHVARLAGGLAMHYHNITPPKLLWRDAPALALQCLHGRGRLREMAGLVSHSAAASRFNARELEEVAFPPTAVVGVLRQKLPLPDSAPSTSPGHLRILFVGRGAPNKCQHDAILALGALTQAGVDAELRLAGSWGGNRGYLERCKRMAARIGVSDAVSFLGSISEAQLASEYWAADVFLCLSEHEGYCVPLIEAMAAGLPIVGFAAGAVPETIGRAGLVLQDKQPGTVAEAILAVHGGALAARMREGRIEQLSALSDAAVVARLKSFVSKFVADSC